jgi:opacity protein-like surface antigen
MKKVFIILALAIVSLNVYSQKGDLSVGLKGGYMSYYKDALYGLDIAYHVSDPLELAFTGLMNSKISWKNEISGVTNDLSIYSTNLDLRLYLLMLNSFAMGPALGGQYFMVESKTDNLINTNVLGFNMGWHVRANVTDNLKINGGWRYTNAKDDLSHHFVYLGVAYAFDLH